MKITPDSLRAGRSLLNINQQQLRDATGMSRTTISHFEDRYIKEPGSKPVKLSQENIEKIISYFKSRGVHFTDNGGVEWIPKNEVRLLSGRIGFRALLDDVYAYAKNYGGPIEILNGPPDLFIKWLGEDWYAQHASRMDQVKDNIQFRIIVDETQKELIAKDFAEYRKIPMEEFNTQTIYIYSDNVAVFSFSNDDVDIKVFRAAGLGQTLRLAFDMFWEKAK